MLLKNENFVKTGLEFHRTLQKKHGDFPLDHGQCDFQ